MRLLYIIKIAAVAFGLATGAAHAVGVQFDVDVHASSVHASSSSACHWWAPCSSIEANLADNLGHTSFSLTEGQSSGWFDFFELSVWGKGTSDYEVSATLAFSDPHASSTALGGGEYFTIFGLISGGNLSWGSDASQQVGFGNGGLYTVQLQEGSILGFGNTAMVQARVMLDAAPVPLPASALLLIAGLGGLGFVRMRRRTALAA